MTHCQSCGKLIASGTTETFCRACRNAVLEEARDALAEAGTQPLPSAASPEPEDIPCVRCRRHPAMDDSHFCLGCQLELVNSLGDAAEELFRTPPPPPLPPVSSTVSLMNDLEAKRDRTATSRFSVAGALKIR